MIQVSKLKKKYKDTVAVKGIHFEIKKGDIHGILGPNGAGKSTMLGCLTGLVKYDEGEIVYEEQYSLRRWSKNIGFVPQELAIYPELSPYENVRFFASLYGFKGKDLEKRVLDAIDFVGLMEVKDKKSSEFSGGMKRRLNLACAIAHSPKVIIMDEPTVGIDPQSRNRILENVKQLNEQGVTIIYTTHYMEEVEAICNKITVIDHGYIIAHGTKAEIKHLLGHSVVYVIGLDKDEQDKKLLLQSLRELEGVENAEELAEQEQQLRWFVEVRCTGEDMADSLLHVLVAQQRIIRSFTEKQESLEDIFLQLTGKALRD